MAHKRSLRDVLRAPAEVDLRAIDPRSTPAAPKGHKHKAEKALAELGERLADLQERLYADGRAGGGHRVLLVLQGLDTSGKDGTVSHVVGQVDPLGVAITAFRAPTPEEREHDFLWRIRRAVPEPGMLGVFNRSHYEDVLVVRVRNLAPRSVWSRRYGAINRFEEQLVKKDTTIVKCFLHISFAEWRERQLARIDDPAKHWKYNPADVDDAALWDAYTDAYQDAIERCNTDAAPWFVVPAERKWHRNLAVSQLLVEHLEALDLQWPPAAFDPDVERQRIAALA